MSTKDIKYPYLPEGRTILYVSSDNQFMKQAEEARNTLSNDGLMPTGAVVVKDGKVIGKAANRAPLGDIKILNNLHKSGLCTRRILKIPSGKCYGLCPGCASPSDHAEQRAIKDAIKKGNEVKGSDLYLYGHWYCCESCWKKMISHGIQDVYLLDQSPDLWMKR